MNTNQMKEACFRIEVSNFVLPDIYDLQAAISGIVTTTHNTSYREEIWAPSQFLDQVVYFSFILYSNVH